MESNNFKTLNNFKLMYNFVDIIYMIIILYPTFDLVTNYYIKNYSTVVSLIDDY